MHTELDVLCHPTVILFAENSLPLLTSEDFRSHNIRVIEMDGTAWFLEKDVCDTLGIISPRRTALDLCDGEDILTVFKSNVRSTNIIFLNRGTTCVNETSIYDLISASWKPEARKFRKWVHGTLLNAISNKSGTATWTRSSFAILTD